MTYFDLGRIRFKEFQVLFTVSCFCGKPCTINMIVYIPPRTCSTLNFDFVIYIKKCLSVCLYPRNVKTAEPIGPKFFVGSRVTPGKVYGWSNFQKFASIKIRFLNNLKIHDFFLNPRTFFCFRFTMYTKKKCLSVKCWNSTLGLTG